LKPAWTDLLLSSPPFAEMVYHEGTHYDDDGDDRHTDGTAG
jgi:hypothetical protein